jgi:hypothetical protein
MTRAGNLALGVLAALVFDSSPACADPVRYWGGDAELSIAEISARTARIVLAPLDDMQKARPAPPSTALALLQPKIKLLRRKLEGPEEVAVGKLRVRVQQGPLTITVTAPAGKIGQELVFADADGSLTFRANAPVLGLGEGGKQFDRAAPSPPKGEGGVRGAKEPFQLSAITRSQAPRTAA